MAPKETHPDPHHHTVATALEDSRDAKELGADENANLCAGCVKCCTYITIEIDAPRAAWEYDQWIWALHHHGIELYVERPERWFLHVETRCERLGADGRCGIYGRHPVLCREYDPRSCERRLPLADMRAWFHTAFEFEAWIRAERPAHWERLMAHRKDVVEAPADAPAPHPLAGLIPLASLTASRPNAVRIAPARERGRGVPAGLAARAMNGPRATDATPAKPARPTRVARLARGTTSSRRAR